MADLNGKPGELTFTLQIKRADTGKVEEYQLVGRINVDELKEIEHGSDSQHSSPQRSD